MSVPLDRLYNFLHDVCDRDDIIIYRFFPHGSRKLSDLTQTSTPMPGWEQKQPVLYHDQEPLNFDAYNQTDAVIEYINNTPHHVFKSTKPGSEIKIIDFYRKLNLRMAIVSPLYNSKPVLLVHSEKNSQNLVRYEELGIVGVYWWSHAVIARDWFRYAEHDTTLNNRVPNVDFLIYNRAWSGTREYRLKFVELLLENQLVDHCKTKFAEYDDGHHYSAHVFKNTDFKIQSTNLEKLFIPNNIGPQASADYDSNDYCSTQLEIILETLFDDDRIQLTEKVLRPIACGHPFMLASTKGSLDYVRSYGFETFGKYIDESYDTILDPVERLKAIVSEMKRLANLPREEKIQLYANLRIIAERNKLLFFSTEWHNSIIQEYKNNLESALLVSKEFKIDTSDLQDIF